MSNAIFDRLRNRIESAAVNAAWRQWAALGAGAASREPATAIVDPEALVLATLALDAAEPRLWDVAASWVARNDGLLSVQRLRNLSGRFPARGRNRLADVAWHAYESSRDARWKTLLQRNQPDGAKRIRGDRNRAGELGFPAPALLWLQLRAGLGVGIRADIVSCLLGSAEEWLGATNLSLALAYQTGSVRQALDDLSQAQFIISVPTHDTDRRSATLYSAPLPRWLPLLGLEDSSLRWHPWAGWFALAADLLEWADEVREREVSNYALGVKGREFLSERLSMIGEARGLKVMESSTEREWPEAFEEDIEAVAQAMETRV